MFNNKAQLGGGGGVFTVLLFGAIALVVVSIVLLTGTEVMGEFAEMNKTELAQYEENTTSPYDCNSWMGTGCSDKPLVTLPVVAVLAILVVSVSSIVESTETTDHEPSNVRDSDTDAITVIQHKYVDGEIETEEQLERELEWYLYPKQNDGDDNE